MSKSIIKGAWSETVRPPSLNIFADWKISKAASLARA